MDLLMIEESVDNTPIFFRTVEEFCRRPKYQLRLQCTSDSLDRIIGKYERPKDNQIQCGLNGCTKEHMFGYVIRAKDGTETNCGQVCGRREFGVKFEEVEALYKKAEDAQLRKRLLTELAENRTTLLLQGEDVHGRVKECSERISKVVTEVEKDFALSSAFRSCIRSGGKIRVENKVDEALRRAKADLITIGEIQGSTALINYEELPKTIYYKFLLPLRELDIAHLDNLENNELEKKTREVKDLSSILANARDFLIDAEKFTEPENLREFSKLKELMPTKSKTGRVDRILSRLPGVS